MLLPWFLVVPSVTVENECEERSEDLEDVVALLVVQSLISPLLGVERILIPLESRFPGWVPVAEVNMSNASTSLGVSFVS